MWQPRQQITQVLAFIETDERANAVRALLQGVPSFRTEFAYTVSHLQRYPTSAAVDVIVLDLTNTPDSDALALIKGLVAPGFSTALIPLTGLITADRTEEFRQGALSAGLRAVFVEPVDTVPMQIQLIMLGRVRQAEDLIRLLAIKDSTTGLFDHRYFFLRLTEELNRARRYSRPITCVICSLDEHITFDDVSDLEGKERTLRQAASILQSAKRDIDVLARTGDREFSLVLYNTDVPGSVVLCERIRSQYGQLDPEQHGPAPVISIGVAEVNANEQLSMHPEEFRQQAVLALRQAQAQGGGCNVIFTPDLTQLLLGE